MPKSKVHYLLVKASFKKPVTAAEAVRETRNLAALSYDTHTASIGEDWDEGNGGVCPHVEKVNIGSARP